jgi:ribosomal protein S6
MRGKRQSMKKKRSILKKKYFRNKSTRRVRRVRRGGAPIDAKEQIIKYKELFKKDPSKKNELRLEMMKDGFTIEETVPVLGKYFGRKEFQKNVIVFAEPDSYHEVGDTIFRKRTNENLFYAITYRDFPRVIKEVDYCTSENRNCINKENQFGLLPLNYVIMRGNRETDENKKIDKDITEYLINNGADINAVDAYGNTPLLYACKSKKPEIVEYLINKGAKINQYNFIKETPFMVAVRTLPKKTVEFLIDRGADIDAKDDQGNTALDFAIKWFKYAPEDGYDTTSQSRRESVIKLLEEIGAKREHTIGEII